MTKSSREDAYDVWIASACLPPDTIRRLLEIYHDTASCYQAFREKDEALYQIVPPRFRGILEKKASDKQMGKMLELMEKHQIHVLRYGDPEYPESLSQIDQAPMILFCQGNLKCFQNRTLSMVGSRAASYAGQKATKKLSCDLSRRNISIVSGLASGIDTASHQGCIEGGSPTIAVTACGLDTVYPRDNYRLRDEILAKNGLIISEYVPGETPAGWHFPFRNRIIAGLGKALILMEARIRSGSMTSVKHALDQGKDVFVYPGDPSSEYFEGNHQLLREGGIYFTSADDILQDLNWLDNQPSVRQNSDCSTETRGFTPEQNAVIHSLEPGNLSFEQLLDRTHLDPPALMSALTILQISGKIESLPGKQYQLKH